MEDQPRVVFFLKHMGGPTGAVAQTLGRTVQTTQREDAGVSNTPEELHAASEALSTPRSLPPVDNNMLLSKHMGEPTGTAAQTPRPANETVARAPTEPREDQDSSQVSSFATVSVS